MAQLRYGSRAECGDRDRQITDSIDLSEPHVLLFFQNTQNRLIHFDYSFE